jgi:type III restriction enzyme
MSSGTRTSRYLPDFAVKHTDGRLLLIEGKGRATEKDQSKRSAASRWVAAVNADGRWGQWEYHVITAAEQLQKLMD